jgi:hypothetical protein
MAIVRQWITFLPSSAPKLTTLVVLVALVVPLQAQAAPPPQSSSLVRFVVAGDSRGDNNGINAAILSEIAQATIKEGAKFILMPGDEVTGSSSASTLQSQLTAFRNTMQPLYDAGIGVYPVRGNHDASSKTVWDAVFSGAYALPGNGPSGEQNVTYSFTYGNILVIGLDEYVNDGRVNQAWLNAQLAANTRQHVFVFGHLPAFSVYQQDTLASHPTERNTFWNSLAAAGVRAYFAGHDHMYNHARLDDGDGNPANDVHQFVAGTAGAPLYTWDGTYEGNYGSWTPRLVYYESDYGYALVEVNGPQVTITWKHRVSPGVYQAGGDVFSYTAGGTSTTPLTSVTIDGPATGNVNGSYAYTAHISPTDATPPITYAWTPTPTSGQGTASAIYSWGTAGSKTIGVTAQNAGGSVTANRTITISGSPPPPPPGSDHLYLPDIRQKKP